MTARRWAYLAIGIGSLTFGLWWFTGVPIGRVANGVLWTFGGVIWLLNGLTCDD